VRGRLPIVETVILAVETVLQSVMLTVVIVLQLVITVVALTLAAEFVIQVVVDYCSPVLHLYWVSYHM